VRASKSVNECGEQLRAHSWSRRDVVGIVRTLVYVRVTLCHFGSSA
jgi:hypothetical protein